MHMYSDSQVTTMERYFSLQTQVSITLLLFLSKITFYWRYPWLCPRMFYISKENWIF